MGGNDDLFRCDRAAGGNRPAGHQLQDLGVFKNAQSLGDGGREFQGMKLGLARKANRPRNGKGKRRFRRKFPAEAYPVQGGQLLFYLPPAVQRIDKGCFLLKAAVQLLAQGAVHLQRLLVCFQVKARLFSAECIDQLMVDQPMLGCYLRRSIFGNPAAYPVRLRQGAVHARLGKLEGAQESGHSPTDYQYIRFQVLLQRLKAGQRTGLRPYRIHFITPLQKLDSPGPVCFIPV